MKLKKTVLSVIACALAFVIAFAFTACGQEEETTVTISAIEIESTAEIDTGATKNVIKQITYSDGTTKTSNDSDIVWTSSNESVATVTRGVVKGVGKGTATITATFGEVTSNECTVTVHSIEVKLTESSITLEKYGTKQLNAEIYRDGSKVNEEIEWSSSSDAIATVDANGLVTAWSKGTATITAKIKGGNQSANCDLTVNWNEPDGYAEIAFAEQNKLTPNVWGYWNGQSGWGSGEATAFEAYIENYEDTHTAANGYEYIGINKATFAFEVTDYLANWTYQTFYRSSDNVEGGKLAYNHDYELTFKIFSNQAGEVGVNPYDDVRAQNEGESDEDYKEYVDGLIDEGKLTEHNFQIEANKETTITVIFRHDDCGYKYQELIYDNMGSAVHLQLAGLGEAGGRVQVSVYDFQFKDLGEADYPVTDDTSKHDGASTVTPPTDLSGEAIAFTLDKSNMDEGQSGSDYKGEYTITAGDDNKSATVEYKTYTSTYEAFYIDVSENEAAQSGNTFAVTVKNNGTTDAKVRFDVNGEGTTEAPDNSQFHNNVVSWSSSDGKSGKVDAYGGTEYTIKAGAEETLYFTYDTSINGDLTTISVYFDTLYFADASWNAIKEERTGNVTISNLFFTHYEVKSATANDVDVVKENDKVYFVVTGTCQSYTLDELKAAHGLYLQSSDWDESKNVTAQESDLTVILNDDGTYEIKWDITDLAAGSYMAHLATDFLGTEYGDLFHESSLTPAIENGGKTYDYVNGDFGGWTRYCLTVTVTEA